MKLAIFNVGGALSCYGEFEDMKFIVDLGSNTLFSPTQDFLIPLSKRKLFATGYDYTNIGKNTIDQLFLSHLDRDHISDYKNYRNYFYSHFMTCPNDNSRQQDRFKINRLSLGVESESRSIVLDDMLRRTTDYPFMPVMSSENPLISVIKEISLFYICPGECEKNEMLKYNYANNISLVLFIKVGDKTVLLPGDLSKEGMKFLIENEPEFKTLLELDGVDYLVAPHHGLQSSFSQILFDTIKDNKVRLNIISEKVISADSNENRSDVDTRYYSEDFSTGDNSLEQRAVKTSLGHIIIDFDKPETEIKKYTDIEDVIEEFSN